MTSRRAQPWFADALLGALFACVIACLYACEGCRKPPPPVESPAADARGDVGGDVGTPTVRLYLLSNVAGALEPCGCSKDQLGGMDHMGAFVRSESAKAPNAILLSAGPLFFMERELATERADQDKSKAEIIADTARELGLVAAALGENDWVGGAPFAQALAQRAGVPLVEQTSHLLKVVNSVSLGIVVVGPKLTEDEAVSRVRTEIDAVKKEGAHVVIALAATGRGEGKRLADRFPELALVLIGKRSIAGALNDTAPPAERIADRVLVIESANHLQTVGVLDLFLRDGQYTFADATGLERAQKRADLTRRMDDLRVTIANAKKDPKARPSDIAAREQDRERLRRERDALDVANPPQKGSFFRFTMQEVREKMGSDARTREAMLVYYKKVNDANKATFANRLPRPAEIGQPSYIGALACASCHEPAKKFWDTTTHSHAYQTLSSQFKEFNLECVNCHVTGYEMPGGSTVTHVEPLKDVQCEVCHGPGSKHRSSPTDRTAIERSPKASVCLACHHPPHVEKFDVESKMSLILGPGHGRGK